MKTNRTLEWMFVFPAVLVIVLAVLVNYLSIHSLSQQHEANVELQTQDIGVLAESAKLNERVAQIHINVTSALDAAISGKMTEADLYRAHSSAVNALAETEKRMQALASSPEIRQIDPQDAQLLYERFDKYRDFVIMSTDISAIDVAAARIYQTQAQNQFNDFYQHANHISTLLAERTLERNNASKHLFQSLYEQITQYGFVGMFAILLLSLLSARAISRQIIAIANGLRTLSKTSGMPVELPAIEQLHTKGTGEFKHMAGALLDFRNAIVQRSKAEKNLRDSEARAQQTLAELKYQKFALDQHSIVATTNAEGKITCVNGKFCDISGYTQQQLIGQNLRLLKSGMHTDEFYSDMYCTLHNGEVWHGEICNMTPSGEPYWLLTTIVPFMDSTNKPQQFIAIHTDITARKATAAPPAEGRTVAEAAKLAESTFLANTSQEMRTPVNAIVGLNHSALQAPATPEQEQRLNPIGIAAEHLLAIIDDFLDISHWFTAQSKLSKNAQQEAPANNIDNAKAEIQNLSEKIRILLVDDSDINLEVTQEILQQLGIQVDTAVNGLQAVEMAHNIDYHLIIMDVHMPEMDGLEAASIIRSLPGRTTTPIIAMTANVSADNRQACMDTGMNDFAPKPVNPDTLCGIILKWLPVAQET